MGTLVKHLDYAGHAELVGMTSNARNSWKKTYQVRIWG